MLRAFTEEYNWAYADGYPDLHFVRQSWRFALWLLHQHGATEKPVDFYADKYLAAFPMLADEVAAEPAGWWGGQPDKRVADTYKLRTFIRFAELFGIVKIRALNPDIMLKEYAVIKGRMLDCWSFSV